MAAMNDDQRLMELFGCVVVGATATVCAILTWAAIFAAFLFGKAGSL